MTRSIPALSTGLRPYVHLLPLLELEISQGNTLTSGFHHEPDGWHRAYFRGPLHLGLIEREFAFDGDVTLDAGPRHTRVLAMDSCCEISGGAP